MSGKWIGVDFDHTLCRDDGSPVEVMVDRVKRWLAQGLTVKIFTARLKHDFTGQSHKVGCFYEKADQAPIGRTSCIPECAFRKYGRTVPEAKRIISDWCIQHLECDLEIVCEKEPGMIELWDDRAVRVERNTGQRLSTSSIEEGPTPDIIAERMRCLSIVNQMSQGDHAWKIAADAIISGKRTTL